LRVDEHGTTVLEGTGRPIGLVRSLRRFENFILEVDWRHLTEAPDAGHAGPGGTSGNSGIYVWADPLPVIGNSFTRAVEVQVCNLGNGPWYTSNGDLFPIHGATMVPDPRFGISGSRSMPTEFRGSKTGEWNHCRITCSDGAVQEELNGALVTAGFRCSPRKGYLCLESEGGPVEFKEMRLTELPGSPELKADQVSILLPVGARTTTLFNGLNLNGWTPGEKGQTKWTVSDRILQCSPNTAGTLNHELPDGEYDLILDWQTVNKGEAENALPFSVTNDDIAREGFTIHAGWNRATIQFRASGDTCAVNNGPAIHIARSGNSARSLALVAPGHAIQFCNIIRADVSQK
jgi:hypothetical protein